MESFSEELTRPPIRPEHQPADCGSESCRRASCPSQGCGLRYSLRRTSPCRLTHNEADQNRREQSGPPEPVHRLRAQAAIAGLGQRWQSKVQFAGHSGSPKKNRGGCHQEKCENGHAHVHEQILPHARRGCQSTTSPPTASLSLRACLRTARRAAFWKQLGRRGAGGSIPAPLISDTA